MAATIAMVLAALLSSCASTLGGGTPPLAPSRSALSSTSQEAPIRPAGALASRQSHLIVVIEENHSFEQIIGSPAAPFLNHLAAHGTLLTNYHAVTHPSLPNYMALLSGRTGRIRSDCRACTIAGPTLVDQLEAGHISWAAYLEGLPGPCSTVSQAGPYTEAVDPFMHATQVRDNPTRCDRILPFARFHADRAARRLSTVTFVVPNLRDDMHSGPVRVADAWLHHLVGELEADPVWQDTRLVVTFDESRRRDVRSCCAGLGRGGRIPTIVAGPEVARRRDRTSYTHYSLLRSIEVAYGLPFLGHAGDPVTATIPAVARPTRGGA